MKFGLIYEIALPSPEEAKARTESEVYWGTIEQARILDEAVAISGGDPDPIVRNIEVYERRGFDKFMGLVQFSDVRHEESLRTIELIGKHVIPRFKRRW